MKKIVNRVIIPAVVAATAALLLAGCQERNGSAKQVKEKPSTELQERPSIELRDHPSTELKDHPSTGLRDQDSTQVLTERRKKIVIDTIRLPRNDAMGWRGSDR